MTLIQNSTDLQTNSPTPILHDPYQRSGCVSCYWPRQVINEVSSILGRFHIGRCIRLGYTLRSIFTGITRLGYNLKSTFTAITRFFLQPTHPCLLCFLLKNGTSTNPQPMHCFWIYSSNINWHQYSICWTSRPICCIAEPRLPRQLHLSVL